MHYEVYTHQKTGEVRRLLLDSKNSLGFLVTKKGGKDHVEKMTHGEAVVKSGEMFTYPDWVCTYSKSRKQDFTEEKE